MLAPETTEAVLVKLQIDEAPAPTREGLDVLYAAWGEHVPWDSVRKRIYFDTAGTDVFPGATPEDFYASWLEHGVGGTCFSGTTALHALLDTLGFRTRLGAGNVLASVDEPVPPFPNHATNVVDFDDGGPAVVVDTSMLIGQVLPIDTAETAAGEPSRRVDTSLLDGTRWIRFRPVLGDRTMHCRIRTTEATADEIATWHEGTRERSIFNRMLVARRNVGAEVVGWSWGQRVSIDDAGRFSIGPADRRSVLIDELGFSEQIVEQIPDDEAM